jgi:uncharacterized protein YbjT (DUF2867 family)
MRVLVYGGTGSQGGSIVGAALARGHETYFLTRDAHKGEALRAKGAHAVVGDLSNAESLKAASDGMDGVILSMPFGGLDPEAAWAGARAAVDAAKAAGVKQLVYNTSGPVIPVRTGNPPYDLRLNVIDYVKQSGLPYIVLQPTAYLENLLGPWTLGGIVQHDTLAYPLDRNVPLGWLATQDLGALAVSALEHPEYAGASWVISGVENVTGLTLAETFSQTLGRTIRYEELAPEAFGDAVGAVLGEDAKQWVILCYRFQQTNAHLITMWTDMSPVLEKLPVRMTSISEWVAQFAPMFAPQQVAV